jgi:ABC-type phosphate/phosphonate transport system ATPase subunit
MPLFGWKLDSSMSDVTVLKRLHEALRTIDLCDSHQYYTGKYMISLFGLTSSGKSAFVNHLLGAYVRESQQGKVDTQFAIIETVSKEEFQQFAPPAKYDSAGLPDLWPSHRPTRA